MRALIRSVGAGISRSGLHQRFNEQSVVFFKTLLERALSIVSSTPEKLVFLRDFGRICLIDSSDWGVHPKLKKKFKGKGGAASKAGVKLHVAFELKSSSILECELTSATVSDQTLKQRIGSWLLKRDLIILDLGYFSYKLFEIIDRAGAFFISRLKSDITSIYLNSNDTNPFDLVSFLKRRSRHSIIERNIFLGNELLPCRLIAQRLSDSEYKKRQRRLKKKKRSPISARARFLAHWSIYITNVKPEVLNAKQIYLAYRLRWNIELLFKQLKSVLEIDISAHHNQFRLQVEIFGTMIVALLILQILNASQCRVWKLNHVELSLEKVFKMFINQLSNLIEIALKSAKNFRNVLAVLLGSVINDAKKDSSPSKPSTFLQLYQTTLT